MGKFNPWSWAVSRCLGSHGGEFVSLSHEAIYIFPPFYLTTSSWSSVLAVSVFATLCAGLEHISEGFHVLRTRVLVY